MTTKKMVQKRGGAKWPKKSKKVARVKILDRGTTDIFKYFSFIRYYIDRYTNGLFLFLYTK